MNIPNRNLRAAIEEALGKASGDPITTADMATLTALYVPGADIGNLTGLEYAINLSSLQLEGNFISDLSPVSGLTNLTELNLWINRISDLSPLVSNIGLGDGDTVDVRDNPLNATSINTHIPTLQRRGVEVQFDESSPRGSIIGITGTVSNPDGTPVVGARITAPGFGDIPTASTTDADGVYSIPYISFANVQIKVGDEITVEVDDTEGKMITRTHIVTAADISAGEVTFDITFVTTTDVIAVTGTITDIEGTPIAGLDVTVTIGSNSQMTVSGNDGRYYTIFFDPSRIVASVGDTVEIKVSHPAIGELVTETVQLSAEQILTQSATVDLQLTSTFVTTTDVIAVTGTITNIDSTPVAGLDVTVTIGSDSQTVTSDDDGHYERTFFDPTAIVASVGDTVEVNVSHPAVGELAKETVQLSVEQILTQSAIIDLQLTSTFVTTTNVIAVEGTITTEDGTPAAGLEVTVTIGSDSQTVTSDDDGHYEGTFFDPARIVASIGDTVEVNVSHPAVGELAKETIQLSVEQILAQTATIDLEVVPILAEYLLELPAGISLIHVPLQVTTVDGVPKTLESIADLYDALGGKDTVNFLITSDYTTRLWHSYSGTHRRGTPDDQVLTDDRGIIAFMKQPVPIQLQGNPLGTNGSSTITLHQGINLVGVPLKDSRITRVSDLFKLDEIKGNVSAITVSDGGAFKAVSAAGQPGDIPITGGQSFIMGARRAATVTISGQGWSNVSGTSAAPPLALKGIEVGDATPVLVLNGTIVDKEAGLNKLGFRVTIKNLSTGRAVTAVKAPDETGYRFTIVDIETGRAATIGDTLKISARSPTPFLGVKPLRYTVTAEDVKRSLIQLPELVVYEIPAETELLANYPNPFNPETWIPYRLAEDAFVTLTIYDGTGQVVRSLEVGHRIAAVYESRSKAIYWDGRNGSGEQVASGVYFYHLSAGDYSATRKLVILK